MSNSQTVKKGAMIAGRVTPEFRKRFSVACAMNEWTVQEAIERVLGQWVDETLRSQSRPGGMFSAPKSGAWEGSMVQEPATSYGRRKRAPGPTPKSRRAR